MSLLSYFKNDAKITYVNLAIRGATLASKFLITIYLAKHLTEEQYGVWGIFSASIALSLYLIGLDFYTYSNRTILDRPLHERGAMLRDQFIFYLISYALLFPFLSLLFVFNIIEYKLIFFFYAVLIFEHMALESYRTFIVFSKPIAANIILFVRTGFWAYILLILWFLGFDELKTLKSVLFFWMSGGAAAFLTSIVILYKIHFKSVAKIKIDWQWIKAGVRVSLFYFAGTVGFKIIEFSDRYFINYYQGKTAVGIYTFYANMSNVIEIFVHTVVIIIFSPMLIESFHKNNHWYRLTHARFARRIVIFDLIACALLFAGIIPIIDFLNKPEYLDNIESLILLSIAEMVYNFTLIFHYILYVRRNDSSITKSTLAAAAVNIILNFILVPTLGISGAAISTLASFLIILFLKAYYSRKFPEARQVIFLTFLRKRNRL